MTFLYKWLGIIAAALAAFFGIRQMGKESAKREQAEEAFSNAKDAEKIDDAVRAMPEPELDKRLSKRTRKKL